MDCCISITDIQCDNQLFRSGFYDFPVVLVGVNPSSSSSRTNPNNKTVLKLIEEARSNSLIQTDLHIEVWTDNITNKKISGKFLIFTCHSYNYNIFYNNYRNSRGQS